MTAKKKILLFTVLLIASAMSTAGFCLTIDAQRETVCGLDYCETTVNLTKYFASSVITNLKTIDLRAFLPSKIQGISYRYDGNSFIVYGKIPIGSKNYWTMNLNGLATIDPWWNTSFDKCKNVSVSYIGGKASLTDFQVPFNITYDSDMFGNFSDVVWVNDTCNGQANAKTLDFYNRLIVPSSWAYGFVEVDNIANNTLRNISIYYDADVQTYSASLINTTCLLGDDFTRANGNTVGNGWTESGDHDDTHITLNGGQVWIVGDNSWDYITHTFTNQTTLGVIYDYYFSASGSSDSDGRFSSDTQGFTDGSTTNIAYVSAQYWAMYTASAWKKLASMSTNTIYDIEIQNYNTTHVKTYQNGTLTNASVPKQGGASDDMAEFNYGGYSTGQTSKLDEVCVRKYDANMPTVSFSAEQTQLKYTAVTLLINNAHANITTGCSWENTNYTASINITGLPVSIMYNETIGSTGTTSTQWYASLIAGVYKITGNYSGNTTHNASSDVLWHTITLGDPSSNVSITFNTSPSSNNTTCVNVPIMVNCSSYALEDGVYLENDTNYTGFAYNFTPSAIATYNFTCRWNASDCYTAGNINRSLYSVDCSETLENSTLSCSAIPDGTISTFQCINTTMLSQKWIFGNTTCTAYETCWNECDNVTMSCNPLPYQQNLYLFGIVGFIAIGMMIIWRRRR